MRLHLSTFVAIILCLRTVNCSNGARIVDEETEVGGRASGGADVGTSADHGTSGGVGNGTSGGGGDTTNGTSGGAGNGASGGSGGNHTSTTTTTDKTRVWFEESVRVEIRKISSYYVWAGDPPYSISSNTCSAISRSVMTQEQQSYLSSLKLLPIDERCKTLTRSCCTSDGYSYVELTVIDRGGSRAVYRDTACVTYAVAGAEYQLPSGAFNSTDFSLDGAELCSE